MFLLVMRGFVSLLSFWSELIFFLFSSGTCVLCDVLELCFSEIDMRELEETIDQELY